MGSQFEIGLIEFTSSLIGIELSLGSLEGGLQTGTDGIETLSADGLLFAASLGVLMLEGSLASSLPGNNSLGLSSAGSLGVGVESLHQGTVLKGVLVGCLLGDGVATDSTELALNLVGVYDSGEVSAGHHASVKLVAALFNTLLTVGTEDLVKVGESVFSEDHESAEVTAGSELKKVESVHRAGVDTGEVTGSSLYEGVLITVDDEGTLGQLETRVSHLVGASTGRFGGTDASEVTSGADGVKGGEKSLGGVNVEGVNNEGQLGNGIDIMASSENERSDGSCGEG